MAGCISRSILSSPCGPASCSRTCSPAWSTMERARRPIPSRFCARARYRPFPARSSPPSAPGSSGSADRRGLCARPLRGRRSLSAQPGGRCAGVGAGFADVAPGREGLGAKPGRRRREYGEPGAVFVSLAGGDRRAPARAGCGAGAGGDGRMSPAPRQTGVRAGAETPKLRVLQVSLHHPELVRGGAQQVCYELFEGLKARGDFAPVLLAATDDSAPALFRSGARITGFDGRPDEHLFLTSEFDPFWHRSSNKLLAESFAEFLRLIRPDVVHFHHFMNFGADYLTLTRRVLLDCRIVFTFHEFLTLCHHYGQMVRRSDRSLCDRGSPVRCHQCFPEIAPEMFFARAEWFRRHLSVVDAFTVPSRFMIDRYVEWGIPAGKIVHIPNGQRNYAAGVQAEPKRGKRNRFGFFGQLVDGKGMNVLLRAAALLRAQGFDDFLVEINGDNLRYATPAAQSEFERLRAAEEALPVEAQRVLFNGPYHVEKLPRLMARVDWCVVPSVWWEVFGLVISEAWMFRRPVIASDVGGMAERIRHDETGLLFPMGDFRALADTLRRAATEKGLWDRLVAALPPAPTRETMVEAYARVYRDGANTVQAALARAAE